MSQPDIEKYCDLMEELKRRTAVVDFFLVGGGHALYQPPTIESVALQLRKMLELIAFGSLVANRDSYSAAYANFAQHWNARLMLRDVERINPDFYPRPVVEAPSPDPRAIHSLKDRASDYLTKDEFEKAYEKCGAILHAENPYGSRIDYAYYTQRLPAWRTQIANLLNNHQIRLVGEPGFWLIHMQENQDDKVHYYKFEPPRVPQHP
ncbi:MAG TPA: hypothetical protein VFW94_04300 [Candidatus Acidoferrales bacterium]|nr:hypothetical protein [Candidatus Acidoferrales bacterium]